MPADLTRESCVPCQRGTPPMPPDEARALLAELDPDWQLAPDARSLARRVGFKNFQQAMAFLNRLAELAEAEGHHPDFCLHGWRHVSLTLTTHAANGLSRNDFILAAKLQPLLGESARK